MFGVPFHSQIYIDTNVKNVLNFNMFMNTLNKTGFLDWLWYPKNRKNNRDKEKYCLQNFFLT